MDDILAKHLANSLLFSSNEESKIDDVNNITFSSLKIIDEKYYIKIPNEVVISKVRGYWNNRPVISYNKRPYAILENSKSLVNLKALGVREIQSTLKEEVNDVTVKKVETKESITNNDNIIDDYKKILTSEDQNSTPKPTQPDDFFKSLEQYKDDPRVKSFFNYHADLAKKELFKITEKFTQQQMARAMESGGGTNAVQYANGGTMKGDLVIDGNLRVTGKMNEGIANNDVAAKKVFIIGDGTLRDYTVPHNLNTKDIIVSVYDTNDEQVLANIKNISLNETRISFSNPILQDSIKVVIIG